ncbi:hypothetical protein LVD15_03925 [Fulvivirga maritima]|uniref:hypothetical protein n=1 Tax=Fulvivirga maritima TaxID=2904247 RepID=UPI001F221406|nr:hypothetical protein [Fulvivirga maritima]UII27584.1 hypothetical protein LVD15_03925 [Fulvivirga maritima]
MRNASRTFNTRFFSPSGNHWTDQYGSGGSYFNTSWYDVLDGAMSGNLTGLREGTYLNDGSGGVAFYSPTDKNAPWVYNRWVGDMVPVSSILAYDATNQNEKYRSRAESQYQRFLSDYGQSNSSSASAYIDNSTDATMQYLNGNGSPQKIGPETTKSLMNTTTFTKIHNAVVIGFKDPSGRFNVDMTNIVFHIGRTPVSYEADLDNGTITYTLYEGDGFWDPDFIDEKVLGGKLGTPEFQPDGPGPNLERLWGTPYPYVPTTITIPMRIIYAPF